MAQLFALIVLARVDENIAVALHADQNGRVVPIAILRENRAQFLKRHAVKPQRRFLDDVDFVGFVGVSQQAVVNLGEPFVDRGLGEDAEPEILGANHLVDPGVAQMLDAPVIERFSHDVRQARALRLANAVDGQGDERGVAVGIVAVIGFVGQQHHAARPVNAANAQHVVKGGVAVDEGDAFEPRFFVVL